MSAAALSEQALAALDEMLSHARSGGSGVVSISFYADGTVIASATDFAADVSRHSHHEASSSLDAALVSCARHISAPHERESATEVEPF